MKGRCGTVTYRYLIREIVPVVSVMVGRAVRTWSESRCRGIISEGRRPIPVGGVVIEVHMTVHGIVVLHATRSRVRMERIGSAAIAGGRNRLRNTRSLRERILQAAEVGRGLNESLLLVGGGVALVFTAVLLTRVRRGQSRVERRTSRGLVAAVKISRHVAE
jgi:hypothetical protein